MEPALQVLIFLVVVLILFTIGYFVFKKPSKDCTPTKDIQHATKYQLDEKGKCRAVSCEDGYYLENGYCLTEVGFHECDVKANNCDVGQMCIKSSCVPCGDTGESCINGLCCDPKTTCATPLFTGIVVDGNIPNSH